MKKQPNKLTLNKEMLRDLTAQNAGRVNGGRTTYDAGYGCPTNLCLTHGCTVGCATGRYCVHTLKKNCH